MARPWSEHCADCIGTLSFPIDTVTSLHVPCREETGDDCCRRRFARGPVGDLRRDQLACCRFVEPRDSTFAPPPPPDTCLTAAADNLPLVRVRVESFTVSVRVKVRVGYRVVA